MVFLRVRPRGGAVETQFVIFEVASKTVHPSANLDRVSDPVGIFFRTNDKLDFENKSAERLRVHFWLLVGLSLGWGLCGLLLVFSPQGLKRSGTPTSSFA